MKLGILGLFFLLTTNAFSSNCFYTESVSKFELGQCAKFVCSSVVECVGNKNVIPVYCLAEKSGRCPSADECLARTNEAKIQISADEMDFKNQGISTPSSIISK